MTTLRLEAARAAELVDRLAGSATARPALAQHLVRLSAFLRARPGTETEFSLLETARAVYPDHVDPIGVFRELRRSVAEFATTPAQW